MVSLASPNTSTTSQNSNPAIVVTPTVAAPLRPPGLQEAKRQSTVLWQDDLKSLFHHAKDRFPDVVWDLADEDGENTDGASGEVWGHKAIVYARAPPKFQANYFAFRPPPPASPSPYSTSPVPGLTQSVLSLPFDNNYSESLRSMSPFRSMSPAPSTIGPGGIMRLSLAGRPTLFSNELEFLYTGKGWGEAFEFLFDTAEKREEGDAEENRIQNLRNDLVFMWRSRLYSDVRIILEENCPDMSMEETETSATVFSSHRFILVSRCPYFYSMLLGFGNKVNTSAGPDSTITVNLPSPPFTPPSLHFTLGFLYTGTLEFSNRTFDLDSAFAIMRSATYLSLQTLYDEIQARIVQEMMHGLFHAFLEFGEYERITGGKWGVGGCKCRQCARRAPRILEFAVSEDVKNAFLERGARRALVGIFGEGWCTPEFAGVPQKTKDGLSKGLAKRTTPLNVFPLLFASHYALSKLNTLYDSWADSTREMVLNARKVIDETLAGKAEECFEQAEWVDLMNADGARFEDGEKVEWVMEAVRRGLTEKNAGKVYQTLVSSILLKPHPDEPESTLLSSVSHIRVQVEQTRMDVLRWISKRWMTMRQDGGFSDLEGWALSEISQEIDIPIDDLRTPSPVNARSPVRASFRSASNRTDDSDVQSMHSFRGAVSRSVSKQPLASSASSIRSVARSTTSVASRHTNGTTTPTQLRVLRPKPSDLNSRPLSRPDSKLAPSRSSLAPSRQTMRSSRSSILEEDDHDDRQSLNSSVFDNDRDNSDVEMDDDGVSQSGASVFSEPARSPTDDAESDAPSTSSAVTAPEGPVRRTPSRQRSPSASSVASTKSRASTIRKTSSGSGKGANAGPSTLRPPPKGPARPASRPTSTMSMRSDASTTFKTATESVTSSRRRPSADSTASRNRRPSTDSTASRNRRVSTASTVSTVSVRSTAKSPLPPIPKSTTTPRARRTSAASVASTTPSVTSPRGKRPAAPLAPEKSTLSPAIKRVPSGSSLRSARSVSSPVKPGTVAARKSILEKDKEKEKENLRASSSLRPVPSKDELKTGDGDKGPSSTLTVKGKAKSDDAKSVGSKSSSGKSGGTASTARTTLRKKESNDTIRMSTVHGGTATNDSASMVSATSHPNGSGPGSSNEAAMSASVLSEPKGATLEIGIPCIVSSKRKRFRAYARYIGEVAGEVGPWVGVEVPVGANDSWADEQVEGRQWNDGTWGGIRYFEVGGVNGAGSEWGDGDYDRDRASRRRRLDGLSGLSFGSGFGYGTQKGMLKREGETLGFDRSKRLRSISPVVSDASNSEYRGLFVRPQQVLYVVDAVGSDL